MDSAEKIRNQVKILCEQMPIRQNIVCLLHYGSVKQEEDFSDHSDLDFHLVLKRIDAHVLRDIKDIFGFSQKIDLSVHALDEIVYDGNLIFQNGYFELDTNEFGTEDEIPLYKKGLFSGRETYSRRGLQYVQSSAVRHALGLQAVV